MVRQKTRLIIKVFTIMITEIFNILVQAGVPKGDLHFWSGASALNVTASKSLLQYLKTATGEEIKEISALLKEKIDIFKSGDRNDLRDLIFKEKQFILQ
jgi:hypothetical protein